MMSEHSPLSRAEQLGLLAMRFELAASALPSATRYNSQRRACLKAAIALQRIQGPFGSDMDSVLADGRKTLAKAEAEIIGFRRSRRTSLLNLLPMGNTPATTSGGARTLSPALLDRLHRFAKKRPDAIDRVEAFIGGFLGED